MSDRPLDLDKRRDEKAMIRVDSQRRRFELLLLVRAVLVDRVRLCELSLCCCCFFFSFVFILNGLSRV